jgi:hypothetical protein
MLACFRFFDEYLAPNALNALAYFNERVSGYWLGQEEALLVRRPRVLARDASGHLHHATGKVWNTTTAGAFTPGMGCACRSTSSSPRSGSPARTS